MASLAGTGPLYQLGITADKYFLMRELRVVILNRGTGSN